MFDTLSPRDRIVMALTEWDRLQSKRDRHHNPRFLGIALGQLDGVDEIDDPRAFVLSHFTGRLVNFILGRMGLPLATREELR